METIAFLGCSRGLGRQVCLEANKKLSVDLSLLIARDEKKLLSLSQELDHKNKIVKMDFSKTECVDTVVDELKKNKVKRLFYFAGGGPYGFFHTKEWKDHLWGLQVSFLTPSEILHKTLRDPELDCVKQIIFVGSLIADHKPDPSAASYSSAKHGLKAMVESILEEGCDRDLRFFRPGYMNTDLLPPNAIPRHKDQKLLEPEEVAKKFISWANNSEGSKVQDIPNQ